MAITAVHVHAHVHVRNQIVSLRNGVVGFCVVLVIQLRERETERERARARVCSCRYFVSVRSTKSACRRYAPRARPQRQRLRPPSRCTVAPTAARSGSRRTMEQHTVSCEARLVERFHGVFVVAQSILSNTPRASQIRHTARNSQGSRRRRLQAPHLLLRPRACDAGRRQRAERAI